MIALFVLSIASVDDLTLILLLVVLFQEAESCKFVKPSSKTSTLILISPVGNKISHLKIPFPSFSNAPINSLLTYRANVSQLEYAFTYVFAAFLFV